MFWFFLFYTDQKLFNKCSNTQKYTHILIYKTDIFFKNGKNFMQNGNENEKKKLCRKLPIYRFLLIKTDKFTRHWNQVFNFLSSKCFFKKKKLIAITKISIHKQRKNEKKTLDGAKFKPSTKKKHLVKYFIDVIKEAFSEKLVFRYLLNLYNPIAE